eukprot:scaffold947_cov375-Prasinococcus_capsulatus_cf.AAC.5
MIRDARRARLVLQHRPTPRVKRVDAAAKPDAQATRSLHACGGDRRRESARAREREAGEQSCIQAPGSRTPPPPHHQLMNDLLTR